jgi:hypothetical protein
MSKRRTTPLNLPPRRRNRFNERELARAIRAAQRAGGVKAIRINQTGAIEIVLNAAGEPIGSPKELGAPASQ